MTESKKKMDRWIHFLRSSLRMEYKGVVDVLGVWNYMNWRRSIFPKLHTSKGSTIILHKYSWVSAGICVGCDPWRINYWLGILGNLACLSKVVWWMCTWERWKRERQARQWKGALIEGVLQTKWCWVCEVTMTTLSNQSTSTSEKPR